MQNYNITGKLLIILHKSQVAQDAVFFNHCLKLDCFGMESHKRWSVCFCDKASNAMLCNK